MRRFGVPRKIVIDNGSQFISFRNGQAESTSKTIVQHLGSDLEKPKEDGQTNA